MQHANLFGGLLTPDGTAGLHCSSNFLERIPCDQVKPFLRECWSILKPGGLLRLVVPDLENLCRTYLHHRDQGEHAEADFVVLELLDQCVRRQSGGELARFYQSLQVDPEGNASIMAFVRNRTGEALPPPRWYSLASILRRLPALFERLWIRGVIQLLPPAFRDQNVSLASVGERHHWLYDFHTLRQLLSANGFEAIERSTASTSCHLDFPFHSLDVHSDGQPRKGAESLFVEALKSV